MNTVISLAQRMLEAFIQDAEIQQQKKGNWLIQKPVKLSDEAREEKINALNSTANHRNNAQYRLIYSLEPQQRELLEQYRTLARERDSVGDEHCKDAWREFRESFTPKQEALFGRLGELKDEFAQLSYDRLREGRPGPLLTIPRPEQATDGQMEAACRVLEEALLQQLRRARAHGEVSLAVMPDHDGAKEAYHLIVHGALDHTFRLRPAAGALGGQLQQEMQSPKHWSRRKTRHGDAMCIEMNLRDQSGHALVYSAARSLAQDCVKNEVAETYIYNRVAYSEREYETLKKREPGIENDTTRRLMLIGPAARKVLRELGVEIAKVREPSREIGM